MYRGDVTNSRKGSFAEESKLRQHIKQNECHQPPAWVNFGNICGISYNAYHSTLSHLRQVSRNTLEEGRKMLEFFFRRNTVISLARKLFLFFRERQKFYVSKRWSLVHFLLRRLAEDTWIWNIIHFSISSILAKNGPSTPTESVSLFSNNEIHGQIAVSNVYYNSPFKEWVFPAQQLGIN